MMKWILLILSCVLAIGCAQDYGERIVGENCTTFTDDCAQGLECYPYPNGTFIETCPASHPVRADEKTCMVGG